MPVTLKDLAKELNLSVVTISKVLRNTPDISAETRERVQKRMKELNYHPNLAARSLITGRTFTVGLVVPDLLHPFFARIAREISAAIRPRGYSLFISSSDEDAELEQQEIRQLLARRVDVLAIASAQNSPEGFREIEELDIPYILIDRRFEGFKANFIGVDDTLVGRLATQHLIEQGCRRVAYIRGPEVSTTVGRLEGYRQALSSAHMELLPNLVVTTGLPGASRGQIAGYEAAKELLSNGSQPDGIFCFNDPVALGAMRAILEAGLRIPEDVAVVGCGNLDNSDFLRVPLSSVDQGMEIIGKRVATLALKLAQPKSHGRPRSLFVEPHLVVRESSLLLRRQSA